MSAIDRGKSEQRIAIVTLLIERGADVNGKSSGNLTPLDKAYISREMETADLLRKHGGKTGDELKAEDIDNPDYQSKPE